MFPALLGDLDLAQETWTASRASGVLQESNGLPKGQWDSVSYIHHITSDCKWFMGHSAELREYNKKTANLITGKGHAADLVYMVAGFLISNIPGHPTGGATVGLP